MKPLCLTCILISIFTSMYILIRLMNSVERSGKIVIPTGGLIFDLERDSKESNPDKRLFSVSGFEYHGLYRLRLVQSRRFRPLRATGVWVLSHSSESKTGVIRLTNFQPSSSGLEPHHYMEDNSVAVLIKFYIRWDSESISGLSVTGTNFKTGESSRTQLTSVGDEPPVLCRQVIFMGPVHEVVVEGFVKTDDAYVIIDELKVSVGTNVFGDLEDIVCK